MTPKELKSSILNLAFQGKLTQQQETDTPIDNLIRDCCEDKADAIAKGKYKKEAFRGSVVCDDYDIPETWRTMHISDMSLFQEGPGILAVDFRPQGIPLIRIAGMKTERLSLEGCNYLDPEMVKGKWSHFKLDLGDIVISTSASMDKVCEVYDDCVGAIPYTGQIRFKMYGGINKEYFKWFIQSPFYIRQINEQKAGAAIKHYGPTHLKKMTIPIAPLEEQRRIVEKIEELLPYIDRYEKAWSKLDELNKRFPDDMQKSVLQMAIQGKLVEQRPEEGTAEELYQKIQEEKQHLIAEGKIKKEKPLPEITEDEVPFDIPRSWKWSCINELFFVTKLAGFEYTKYFRKENISADFPVHIVRAKNVKMDSFIENEEEAINKELSEILSRSALTKDCLLMTFIGAGIGDTCIYHSEKRHHLAPNVAKIEPQTRGVFLRYFLFWLMSPEGQKSVKTIKKSTAQPSLSMETIRSIKVAIPPLAEQKRIVQKLDEILPLCERLK